MKKFVKNSEAPGAVLLLVFLGRFLLTMICYGSGEIGGIFAPMLALATLFSLGLAQVCDAWFPGQLPQPGVFCRRWDGGISGGHGPRSPHRRHVGDGIDG